MLHDSKKKAIYYDNALVKIYDIPIFYFPKLSHPDPNVDRRSGFLTPSFTDTKNLGSGLSIPYYWAIGGNRDFTFTNKIYADENPLFLGEYRHAFKNSNLIFDMGYTDGYKKTSSTKRAGDKSHFFPEIVSSFSGKNGSENSLTIKNQHVSNDKYLKLYRIKSNLVDYNQDNIENSLSFTREDENFFLGVNASIYENLKENYNDKYEYILPEITFDKNLVSNDFIGNLDLQSNLKVRNYDTNKTSKFFINDLDWNFKNFNSNSGLTGKLIGKVKNINYEAKNITTLKETTVNELHGALGYLTKLELFKKNKDSSESSLIPKLLLRYAPKKYEKRGEWIKNGPFGYFCLDRLNNQNNF